MRDVVDLLTALNVRCSAGPLGVAFSWYFDRGNLDREGRHRYRVESGSGVAGRGHAWNVVELARGHPAWSQGDDEARAASPGAGDPRGGAQARAP